MNSKTKFQAISFCCSGIKLFWNFTIFKLFASFMVKFEVNTVYVEMEFNKIELLWYVVNDN